MCKTWAADQIPLFHCASASSTRSITCAIALPHRGQRPRFVEIALYLCPLEFFQEVIQKQRCRRRTDVLQRLVGRVIL